MSLVNLTKHAIVIINSFGTAVTYPPSGTEATVETVETPNGVFFDDIEASPVVTRIPVVTRVFGEVVGLPEPRPNTGYLVSSIVLEAIKGSGRADVYAPDSGSTAIRNEKGHVTAVTRLVSN